MQEKLFKQLLDKAPFAYGYHKLIRDEKNDIIGFFLVYANSEMQQMLNFNDYQNKNIDISNFYKEKFDIRSNWNEIFSKLKDNPINFEYFDRETFDYYLISVNNEEIDYFSITMSKLFNSEKKNIYRKLIYKAHEGITIIQNNKFVFFNPMVEHITGYSKEELHNMTIEDLVHIDDLEMSFDNYKSSPFESYVEPYQIRIVNKKGEVKWIELSTTDFEWNEKEAALCLLIDVTKRKEIEDLLKESERRKNLLIKGMNNLILILDSNFTLLEYYSSSNKIFFLKPKRYIGKKLENLRLPENVFQKIHRALMDTKTTEKPSHVEFCLDIFEKKYWFDISITVIQDEITHENEFLCVVREITLLKESEIEIKAERDLFSAGPVMTVVWDHVNWKIKRVSKNVEDILGYKASEILDENFDYKLITHKEDQYKASNEITNCVKNCVNSLEQSYRMKHKNGKYLWFYDFTKIIRDKDGNIQEIRGYLFDQSHIKEVEQQLENERERLKNIIKGTNAGTWEWNIKKDKIILDNRWSEIIGYSLEEIQPMSIKKLSHFMLEEDIKNNEILLRKHFNGETDYFQTELRLLHKQNYWVWVVIHGKVLNWTTDKKPEVMFGTILDITEKKKVDEKILEASIKDPLTNLYNRRYIFDRLKELKAKYKRNNEVFSVALIDLDYFKNINDSYGHIAGDFVLQEFSAMLSGKFRAFDLIGRYGGEEFIVVMAGCTKEDAGNRIEMLLDDVRNRTFEYNENSIKFTFSCGISDSTDLENLVLDRLIDLADKRLYKAKNFGRNRVTY